VPTKNTGNTKLVNAEGRSFSFDPCVSECVRVCVSVCASVFCVCCALCVRVCVYVIVVSDESA